jgi:hypothetical protein
MSNNDFVANPKVEDDSVLQTDGEKIREKVRVVCGAWR